MGVNYYSSNDKTMAHNKYLFRMIQPQARSNVCKFYCKGQIIAFDLALWFCF
jgi:hypothetical protein